MRPPKRDDFEKVSIGDFIEGTIVDIEYDNEHKFKGFQGGEDRISPAVRIVLELDGYKFPHRTSWMTFSYGDRTNLFTRYMVKLVEGAQKDMDFDLDNIKQMRVKTLWTEKDNFQFIESIFPLEGKISVGYTPPEPKETDIGPEPGEEESQKEVI